MKPIPFPLWPEDWLTSEKIDCMTAAEERGYLRLLLKCWLDRDCSIPADHATLARWSLLGRRRFEQAWTKIYHRCFVNHPTIDRRLINEKTLDLWEETHERRAKMSANGSLGAEKRWHGDGEANGKAIASPSPSPSPSISPPTPSLRGKRAAPSTPPEDLELLHHCERCLAEKGRPVVLAASKRNVAAVRTARHLRTQEQAKDLLTRYYQLGGDVEEAGWPLGWLPDRLPALLKPPRVDDGQKAKEETRRWLEEHRG